MNIVDRVRGAILIVVCCCDVSWSQTTDPGPCAGESGQVCQHDGDGRLQLHSLLGAVNQDPEIDMIFLIDTTLTQNTVFNDTKTFITFAVQFLSLNSNFTIHPDMTRVAILGFNSVTTVWFNGISRREDSIDYCQFNDILNKVPLSDAKSDTKLRDALIYLGRSFLPLNTRSSSQKVVWIFSDAGVALDGVVAAANNVKQQGAVVFTTGVGQCPSGWFDELVKESTMRAVATSDSYYACSVTWWKVIGFTQNVNKKSLLFQDGDHPCLCDVVHGTLVHCNSSGESSLTPAPSVPVIAVAVGASCGGVVLVAIIIVVAVGCFIKSRKERRRLLSRPLPPPPLSAPRVPRRTGQPPRTSLSKHEYANAGQQQDFKLKNMIEGQTEVRGNDYVPCPHKNTLQNGFGDEWIAFLKNSAHDNHLQDLAIYSTGDDPEERFARTEGFEMSEEELKTIASSMQERSRGGTIRANKQSYHVTEIDRLHLKGSSTTTEANVSKILLVYRNKHFFVVGDYLSNENSDCSCENCLQDILKYASSRLD